ncbi:PP0621 family protein [Variovorax sp. DT-64]|uniref:PP0621 family protein n=1 Tax=Variovorax sp. DT-64 TaxID=3396160 RepID=UPI003F1C1FDB
MKYLLVLAIILVAIWLWRKGRREELQSRTPPPAPPPPPGSIGPPQAMLRCAHCGLHLPAADAVRDADGTAYCSAAHRLAATH